MAQEFEGFFRSAYPKVVATLRHMGYGLEEAADSAAEAMIQLLTHQCPIGNPLAWVTMVAFRDAARNAKRSRMRVEKSILAARRELRSVLEVHSEQLSDIVNKILDKLSQGPRQVIVLYYHGFTTYEIAQVLGTREATVRSHKRHAVRQLNKFIDTLRAELSGEFDEFLTLLQAKEVSEND